MTPATRNPGRGIGLKIASVAVFASMIGLVKLTAQAVPPGQQVFFRSAFALPVLIAWLRLRSDPFAVLRTPRPLGHFVRGLAGTAAMAMSFAAAGLLPLPELTALGYTTPLLVVIFAALILHEQVGRFRLTMVTLGLGGVLVVLWPRLGAATVAGLSPREGLGVVLALCAATCTALAMIFVKRLVAQEHPATVVFWFTVTSTTLSLATLPWGWVLPDPGTAAVLVMIGVLGGLGQILMTTAYRYADASLVAPFEYVSMLLAIAIGYLAFAEVPDINTLVGAGIIITAGTLLVMAEGKVGRTNRRRVGQSSKPNIS